jgi:hypothetical protein
VGDFFVGVLTVEMDSAVKPFRSHTRYGLSKTNCRTFINIPNGYTISKNGCFRDENSHLIRD